MRQILPYAALPSTMSYEIELQLIDGLIGLARMLHCPMRITIDRDT